MAWLPDGEKSLLICLAVSTIPACDGQTDRHLPTAQCVLSIASRGKICILIASPSIKVDDADITVLQEKPRPSSLNAMLAKLRCDLHQDND